MRVFITGSSDGIGQAAAKVLAQQGHKVTLHARSPERAKQAHAAVPDAEGVLIGDISTTAGSKELADKANKAGPWDTVVHNAALGLSATDTTTEDGIKSTFAVNSLAPYVLTALMEKPKKLLYLTSSLHMGGDDSLKDIAWMNRRWQPSQAYNDSKLQNIMLANYVARAWPDVQSASLDPGWVQTKLGGGGAPGTTAAPAKAIADYVAGSGSLVGDKTGVYFNPQGPRTPHKAATDMGKQDEYVRICEQLSGVSITK